MQEKLQRNLQMSSGILHQVESLLVGILLTVLLLVYLRMAGPGGGFTSVHLSLSDGNDISETHNEVS